MSDRPRRRLASLLALALGLPGTASMADQPAPPAKAAEAPKLDAPAPRARSPFHPHTVPMLRQSNRLRVAGQGSTAMNDGEIVLALSSAWKLLDQAGPDDQGHKAEAAREVDAAIRQVRSRAGLSAAPARPAQPQAGPKPARPRAESDALLREALHSLTTIESHMATGGNVRRLAAARDSVRKAIEDLKAALDLR